MGVHFVNGAVMASGKLDPLKPPILVYQPTAVLRRWGRPWASPPHDVHDALSSASGAAGALLETRSIRRRHEQGVGDPRRQGWQRPPYRSERIGVRSRPGDGRGERRLAARD